jgi:multimeric flavodoxin WrbA
MILILNGSPKKSGKVATLLRAVEKGLKEKGHKVEWINVYDLKIAHCIACMKCRPDGRCILPEDGGHSAGDKIAACEGLVVGTPTHWGNMSAQLKMLFDRNVPLFMGEKPNGFPIARQKGKPALIVTACSTPLALQLHCCRKPGGHKRRAGGTPLRRAENKGAACPSGHKIHGEDTSTLS